ncbi:MAG: caspase family protein [Rhizobiaceae bacterium]|nr:caspase family protein [Rhizobiaceae bacterium]
MSGLLRTFAAVATLLAVLSLPALADRRIALVVGNSDYQHIAKLANPRNDAEDLSKQLAGLGFEVMGGTDLDRRSLVEQLIKFGRAAGTADVALFFYAGHGIQVNGQNYLVPVDAMVEYEAEADISLVSLSGVLQQMERGSETNLIFLDACRNNPFADQLARSENRSAQSISKGLGRVQSGSGTFIAFATQPDAVASDGAGRNSPFTGALLKHISAPGQSISDLMIEVRNDVMAATGGKQVPWDSSSLTGRFEFAARQQIAAAQQSQPQESGASEKEAYEQAVAVGSCGALEAFMRRYPDSFYAELAKERAASACAAPTAEQVASAPSVATATRSVARDGTCERGPFDVDYCASSVLKPSKAIRYEPSMMFDGNRETAWVEGEKDDGLNETLTLHFGKARLLSGFEIINGYDKTESIWQANSRVKTLEATTGDGQTLTVGLQDVRGASRVDFKPAIRTEWLELRIKDVYPGSKYKDTAISELYPVFAD